MRISVIGCGNMGAAIASALADADWEVSVYDKAAEKAEALAEEKSSISVLSSIDEASGSGAIIIAVKPQVLPSLYESLKEVDTGLWISIAAGVPLSVLEDHIGTENVVRFMPNIGAKARKSVTAIAAGSQVSMEQRELALSIAASFGSAYFLQESLFPAFIGISGSGIAYFFEMMHQMAMAGVKEGIPYPESLAIVRDTAISAAEMQKSCGRGAIELETMVCSAAGTTIEGIKALQEPFRGIGDSPAHLPPGLCLMPRPLRLPVAEGYHKAKFLPRPDSKGCPDLAEGHAYPAGVESQRLGVEDGLLPVISAFFIQPLPFRAHQSDIVPHP